MDYYKRALKGGVRLTYTNNGNPFNAVCLGHFGGVDGVKSGMIEKLDMYKSQGGPKVSRIVNRDESKDGNRYIMST